MINYSESKKSIVLYQFTEKAIWGQFGDELMFCTYGTLDAPEFIPNGSCSSTISNTCLYREYI
jgi:hypothetical protein